MFNFSLANLKSWFNLDSLDDKENRYKTILDRIELLKAGQELFIFQHEEVKADALIRLQNVNNIIGSSIEAQELFKAINVKYNKYFTNFLNSLSEIKKDYNKQERKLAKLYKDEEFKKAQDIKDEEFLKSLIVIADLYQQGKIEEDEFQKVKDEVKKGGFAVGTIRNWADGKYRKDPGDIWTKISSETSGSGASESALRTEISKTYDLFQLKKKIEQIPEKYRDSPLAKMAKQIYEEKDEKDWEFRRKMSIEKLKSRLERVKGYAAWSEERKTFEIERSIQIIAEKEDFEKLSPEELEAKGHGFLPGTVREWKGGKYIKEADGTWRKMSEPLTTDQIADLDIGQEITVVEDDRIEERVLASGKIKTALRSGEGGDAYTTEIVVEDDDTGNLVTVKFNDMSEIKLYKESVKGFIKKKKSYVPFPPDFSKVKTTKSLGGSSDVKLAEWDEKTFALKTARESKGEEGRKQLKYEYIANSIYRAMGFNAPKGQIYENGQYLMNQFLEGKELGKVTFMSNREKENAKKGIQGAFVLDALLGNWDVIGGDKDNILVADDKISVFRIDNGGCFQFRARGGIKDFPVEVKELETLKKHNPDWFGDIDDEEIQKQINNIVGKKDKLLTALEWEANQVGLGPDEIKELYTVVNSRISWLENWKSKDLVEKGDYPSGITNTYFADWDKVEVPETINKDILKRNIILKEREYEEKYKEFAKKRGISVEEYKGLLQKRVEDIIAHVEFFRATDSAIVDKIIHTDGRWKSQFETESSDGTYSPKIRAEAENHMFGSSDNPSHEKTKRCIYGYWSDNTNGVLNPEGHNPPPNAVSQYGDIVFKVKREIALKKATITFGDSLDTGVPPARLPVSASKPHFSALVANTYRDKDPLDIYTVGKLHKWGQGIPSRYSEVQYHTGLSMGDIESVHLSHNISSAEAITKTIEQMMYYAMQKKVVIPIKYYVEK